MKTLHRRIVIGAVVLSLTGGQFFILKPQPAQAFWGVGDFTFNTEVGNWYDIIKDIGLAAAQRIAVSYANKYLTQFVDKVVDKYRIKDYLAYDRVLSGYYLNRYIYEKVDDPDLQAIYGLLARDVNSRAQVTTPTGQTQPLLAALQRKLDDYYYSRGGINPNYIYYPGQFSFNDQQYFAMAQAYFSNPPNFSQQQIYGNFGQISSLANGAASQEVANSQGLKNGRANPGLTGTLPKVCSGWNPGPYQPAQNPRSSEANCLAAGGRWVVDATGTLVSAIQNPSGFIHDFATNAIESTFQNSFKFDPTNPYAAIGSFLGNFIFKKLTLDSKEGTFNEFGTFYQGSSISTVINNLDLDGDNIPDGQDGDNDGKLDTLATDTCYHGGVPSNCKKSSQVSSSPYFTPVCQSVDRAVLALTQFLEFIKLHADQIPDGENLANKADGDIWARRAQLADAAVEDLLSSIQSYNSSYFDNMEITIGRYQNFLSKITQSLQKDQDLDLSGWRGLGGGGLGALTINTERMLNYLKELKSVIGKCENPNIQAMATVPPPVIEGPPGGGGQGPCTALGQAEQDFMLPLLRSGTDPAEVARLTNQQFNLSTGSEAVYYPANNTIGLPEFYIAGHTDTDPGSPPPGEWNVVERCSRSGGDTLTCANVPGAIACNAQDQTELVRRVKQYLENQGVDLSGPCGAFEITRRVAWALRNTGGGLLQKPSGNNCNGFSTDFVGYTDRSGVDILGDSGGQNNPQWLPEPPGQWNYASPIDPGDPAGSY